MFNSLDFEQDEDQKPPSLFSRLQSDHFVHGAKIMESKVEVISNNQMTTQEGDLILYDEYLSIDISDETFIFPLELTISFKAVKENLEIRFRDESRELEVTLKFSIEAEWKLFFREIRRYLFQIGFEEKYGVMEIIGSGRSSEVYKIIEKETGVIFAAKHCSSIPSSIETELKILRMLEHPNIMYFHEVFLSQGELFIVMDYEDGGNLLDKIKDEEFPTMKEKTKFLLDMLNALEFLRIKGIIHRDLKPENILYSKKDDSFKITDFCLSIFANKLTPKTVGTPGYIAPEIFESSEEKPYTHESDIYSLGLIYFELATKKTFFLGDTAEMVLHNNRKGKSLKKVKYSKEHISDIEYDVLRMMIRTEPNKRLLSLEILQSSELRKLVKDYSLGKKSLSSSTSSNKKKSPQRKNSLEEEIEPNIEEENFMDVMKKILRRKTNN